MKGRKNGLIAIAIATAVPAACATEVPPVAPPPIASGSTAIAGPAPPLPSSSAPQVVVETPTPPPSTPYPALAASERAARTERIFQMIARPKP